MDKLIILWLALCWFTLTAGLAWGLERLERWLRKADSTAKEKRPLDCHPSERTAKTYQPQYTTNKGEKAR